MKQAINKVGISGFATILALVLSAGMIAIAAYSPTKVEATYDAACTVCNGSCGSTGCSYSCGDGSDQKCHRYQARFMCDGRIHTACNEHTGESIGSAPNLSDPKYWCKTFQFDSNADNGAYSMVFVGDGGKVCVHKGGQPEKCDPDDLDWDCDNKPVKPVEPPPTGGGDNRKPVCDSLTVSKNKVTSLDEPITVTVKGHDPDEKNPMKLLVWAAAGGQTNRNPGDYYCTFSNLTDPDYSFYCGGESVWYLAGSANNTSTHKFTTTFRELEKGINGLPVSFSGSLRTKGINLTANIVGSFSNDLCSSNIARFDGNGAYYNGGKWNVKCEGGCNQFIVYQAPAKPAEPKSCNQACQPDQCADGLKCVDGACRNPSCTEETDCTCPTKPAEPRCGDNVCNQDSEQCENGKSCNDGSSVACRNDCTYCGDGIVNGDEECDGNTGGKGETCSNECKWVTPEHKPVDTAGGNEWVYITLGFTLLAAGATTMYAVVPMKRKLNA